MSGAVAFPPRWQGTESSDNMHSGEVKWAAAWGRRLPRRAAAAWREQMRGGAHQLGSATAAIASAGLDEEGEAQQERLRCPHHGLDLGRWP